MHVQLHLTTVQATKVPGQKLMAQIKLDNYNVFQE